MKTHLNLHLKLKAALALLIYLGSHQATWAQSIPRQEHLNLYQSIDYPVHLQPEHRYATRYLGYNGQDYLNSARQAVRADDVLQAGLRDSLGLSAEGLAARLQSNAMNSNSREILQAELRNVLAQPNERRILTQMLSQVERSGNQFRAHADQVRMSFIRSFDSVEVLISGRDSQGVSALRVINEIVDKSSVVSRADWARNLLEGLKNEKFDDVSKSLVKYLETRQKDPNGDLVAKVQDNMTLIRNVEKNGTRGGLMLMDRNPKFRPSLAGLMKHLKGGKLPVAIAGVVISTAGQANELPETSTETARPEGWTEKTNKSRFASEPTAAAQ